MSSRRRANTVSSGVPPSIASAVMRSTSANTAGPRNRASSSIPSTAESVESQSSKSRRVISTYEVEVSLGLKAKDANTAGGLAVATNLGYACFPKAIAHFAVFGHINHDGEFAVIAKGAVGLHRNECLNRRLTWWRSHTG